MSNDMIFFIVLLLAAVIGVILIIYILASKDNSPKKDKCPYCGSENSSYDEHGMFCVDCGTHYW